MKSVSKRMVQGLVAVCAVTVGQACGGSDSGSGGGGTGSTRVDTGLPPERGLDELSSDEAAAVGRELGQAADAAISNDTWCTFFGAAENIDSASGEIDTAACEESRDLCLSSGEAPEFSGGVVDTEQLASCSATVSEFESCYSAMLSRAAQVFGALSCTRTVTVDEIQGFDPDAQPPECDVLNEKCPELLSSEPGGGGGSLEPSASGCDDTCEEANDGFCDDGGPDADFNSCGFGTDCSDCGEREPA